MLLAIDIGNTDTKLGLYPLGDGPLAHDWRVATIANRTADEYGILLATLLGFAGLARERVTAVAVASVVPQTDGALGRAIEVYFGVVARYLHAGDQQLMLVSTDRPRELGADLLAAAIAAHAAYGGPLVVVGFGTASTYAAISREGEFLGVAIAPGIRTALDALVARAAKLPQVAIDAPNGPIGRDTISAMQAGIVFGAVGATEHIVARMRAAIGEDARVVATGGLAAAIAKHAPVIDAVEPHLVLEGLRRFHAAW